MGVADWASGLWFPIGSVWGRPPLAARLVGDPTTVITNLEHPLEPGFVRSVQLVGGLYYANDALPKFAEHFPHGWPVLDNPPG